jgi:hypothetical protein
MEALNISIKLIRLVKLTLEGTECCVWIQTNLSEPIHTRKGLHQGDAFACLLLSTTLEKVIRDSNIQTHGTIFCNSTQILSYTDNIDKTGRTLAAMTEAYILLERAPRRMGLLVNKQKKIYVGQTSSDLLKEIDKKLSNN